MSYNEAETDIEKSYCVQIMYKKGAKLLGALSFNE